jgi:hypothetical protein
MLRLVTRYQNTGQGENDESTRGVANAFAVPVPFIFFSDLQFVTSY